MKYLLLLIFLVISCEADDHFVFVKHGDTLTAGEQVVVTNGFYKGCKGTVSAYFAFWADTYKCSKGEEDCSPLYELKNILCKGTLTIDKIRIHETDLKSLGVTNRKSL